MMEFHISRKARDRYQFAESLFSYSGNVVFANLAACREFAQRMNTVRDVERHPERVVHAGKLYAMGLIDEASHVLMARYREQFDPEVMTGALEWFAGKVGSDAVGKLLLAFVEQFPGMKVMRGEQTPVEWLAGRPRERRTGPSLLKSLSCSGRRTAMRRSILSRSFSRRRAWPRGPFTAR
jgi:hypothetical protein